MRIKNLDSLKRKEAQEIELSSLPKKIRIHDYALEKGYKTNELVKKVHKSSYEWYGFLLAKKEDPETVIDIGMGENGSNGMAYTKIEPEKIQEFLAALPADYLINGWIHSHGDMNFRHFSGTDDSNMSTVLSFTSLATRKPINKKEILVDDLSLIAGSYDNEALKKGSLSVVLEGEGARAQKAKIFETIFGGFSYSIVVGDEKWNEQTICYERKSLLTGETKHTKLESEKEQSLLEIIVTGRKVEGKDLEDLKKEVKDKIKPDTYTYSYTPGAKGYLPGMPYSGYGYPGEEFEEGEVEGGARLFLPKGKNRKKKGKGIFRRLGFGGSLFPGSSYPNDGNKDDDKGNAGDNGEKKELFEFKVKDRVILETQSARTIAQKGSIGKITEINGQWAWINWENPVTIGRNNDKIDTAYIPLNDLQPYADPKEDKKEESKRKEEKKELFEFKVKDRVMVKRTVLMDDPEAKFTGLDDVPKGSIGNIASIEGQWAKVDLETPVGKGNEKFKRTYVLLSDLQSYADPKEDKGEQK